MNAGRLNRRVTIQQPDYADDGAGGKMLTGWSDIITVWADVKPATGGEAFRAGIANATQFYRISIRFRSGITPVHRLMFNGVPLNIRTCADPDGRRVEFAIVAESGVADG